MERPIILKAHEVRGILDGRQTQLRRIAKSPKRKDGLKLVFDLLQKMGVGAACPFGQVGDRLWGRETWAHYHTLNHIRCQDGRAFDEVSDGLVGYREDGHDTIEDFRDHVRLMSGADLEGVIIKNDRWCPSTQMPRWASRILLEIVSVRVERLQDISDADAMAQGCKAVRDNCHVFEGSGYDKAGLCHGTPKIAFGCFWEDVHGQDSWTANPWVWVVEFKRVGAQ